MIVLSQLTKRFKIALEESWQGETAKNLERRWLEIVPCHGFKKGPPQEGPFISLFSEDPPTLQLYTNRVHNAKNIWQRIKNQPGCRADFALNGEAIIFFSIEVLELVCEMAGARKRRQLSEAQKEAMARGREMAGLVRDEKGRIIHCQAQNLIQNEAIPTKGKGEGQGKGEAKGFIELRRAENEA